MAIKVFFTNDPFIKWFTQFNPKSEIEDFIHNIFYWDRTKTMFVVTKPLQWPSDVPIKSSALRYYSIDTKNSCDQIYTYSKTSDRLSSALNSVIDPLDLCFFSPGSAVSDYILLYRRKHISQKSCFTQKVLLLLLTTHLVF